MRSYLTATVQVLVLDLGLGGHLRLQDLDLVVLAGIRESGPWDS